MMIWNSCSEFHKTYNIGMVRVEAECVLKIMDERVKSGRLSKADAMIAAEFCLHLQTALKKS